MGLGGISLWQLLIVLLIVVLIFGTRRLRGMGQDLGGAVRSFRKAMDDADANPASLPDDSGESAEVVDKARERADS